MSDQEDSKCIRIQFGAWLIAQISSGKYPGLEWIDEDEKTMFKIPWTKINYPMWEEHHKIFQAWAVYRGKTIDTTTNLERSVSQTKSNFRTILRKCVDIEEVEQAHQLGLQMGNYKVYRILSRDESIAKRKSQQQTRQAYKWLKRMEDQEEKQGTAKDLLNEEGAKFFDIIAKTKRKSKKTKLKAFINNQSEAKIDQEVKQQTTAMDFHSSSNTRSISTQTYLSDTTDVTFVLEPAAYEETTVSEMDTSPSYSSSLHSSVSTQSSEKASGSESRKTEAKFNKTSKTSPNTLDGFQMLLQAAQMAEGQDPSMLDSGDNIRVNRISPSVVDVLVELKIPPEELFTYEMSVRYEGRNVMEKTVLGDMNYGYRIYYGSKDHVKSLNLDLPEFDAFRDDFARTPIPLPESHVLPGNSLYTVLKNISGGLVLKSDQQQYILTAKRLCLSRIYSFTSYGETPADNEPVLLSRNQEILLFSYKKFLADWHRFLVEGSPKPNHEINFAFGKKTKHRHSRVFVSVTLVPKAADSMLSRIAESLDEKTLDNVLKLFGDAV